MTVFFEGSTAKILITSSVYDFFGGGPVLVRLIRLSPELYTYQRSLRRSNYSFVLSRPSRVHTNIVNGLGVFGGEVSHGLR